MNLDLGAAWDAVKDGTKEITEVAHERTSAFHDNYVSKIVPDCGKYGDEAKFIAEMVPGVAEYNAIKDGDWTAFAIAAGIDIAAIAIGVFSAGAGYAAVKGGSTAAKAGVRIAVKEIAEAGTETVIRETFEAGVKTAAKETVESGVEVVAREAAEIGIETIVKESVETGLETVTRETLETGAETVTKDVAKTRVERAVLEVGDKIDLTQFSEYMDEIENITHREILPKQKALLEKAIKENDFSKQSKEVTQLAKNEYRNRKPALIQTWEEMTGTEWPKYTEDILNESGEVIRKAGQPFDAHHIIEISTGGPNEWWNLHPAKFPAEHQNGIHAAGSLAKKIFG